MTQNQALIDHLSRRNSAASKMFMAPYPDRAALGAIIDLALRTPDHGKLEPWRLVALERDDLLALADLGEERARDTGGDAQKIEKGRSQFARSHAAVVVISSPRNVEKVPLAEQHLSAGALCMNILHSATAMGWGANWLTGWVAHDHDFIVRAFGCHGAETVAGIIHFGTPGAVAPERPRPDAARVVQWGIKGVR
jgi:nitroreductase